MDIWGTKARRLQKELDQAREDLREAREMLNGVTKIVEDTVDESDEDKDSKAVAGASILFLQNRRKKVAGLENG